MGKFEINGLLYTGLTFGDMGKVSDGMILY